MTRGWKAAMELEGGMATAQVGGVPIIGLPKDLEISILMCI